MLMMTIEVAPFPSILHTFFSSAEVACGERLRHFVLHLDNPTFLLSLFGDLCVYMCVCAI